MFPVFTDGGGETTFARRHKTLGVDAICVFSWSFIGKNFESRVAKVS